MIMNPRNMTTDELLQTARDLPVRGDTAMMEEVMEELIARLTARHEVEVETAEQLRAARDRIGVLEEQIRWMREEG